MFKNMDLVLEYYNIDNLQNVLKFYLKQIWNFYLFSGFGPQQLPKSTVRRLDTVVIKLIRSATVVSAGQSFLWWLIRPASSLIRVF